MGRLEATAYDCEADDRRRDLIRTLDAIIGEATRLRADVVNGQTPVRGTAVNMVTDAGRVSSLVAELATLERWRFLVAPSSD